MKGPVCCRLASDFPSRHCFALAKQPPKSLVMTTLASISFACPNLERFPPISLKMANLRGGGGGYVPTSPEMPQSAWLNRFPPTDSMEGLHLFEIRRSVPWQP